MNYFAPVANVISRLNINIAVCIRENVADSNRKRYKGLIQN
jgi:hypothetical protein